MKLIIGLGNPGKKYVHTRHNAGFMVLDALAKEYNATWKKDTGRIALIATCAMRGVDVLLAKPLTYMNASGDSAQKIIQYYKIDHADILVVYDDIDVLLGETRLREEGSSGGQNGMQSIIDAVGTQAIARLRVGVAEEKTGKQDIPAEAYVLQSFSENGAKKISTVIPEALQIIETWVSGT